MSGLPLYQNNNKTFNYVRVATTVYQNNNKTFNYVRVATITKITIKLLTMSGLPLS